MFHLFWIYLSSKLCVHVIFWMTQSTSSFPPFLLTLNTHKCTVTLYTAQYDVTKVHYRDNLAIMYYRHWLFSIKCIIFIKCILYWGFFPSHVRRMRLINELVKYYEKWRELALVSSFTTLSSTGNFTSDGLSVPEEMSKHPQKLWGTWPRTVASLRRLTANLSWLLPSSHLR